MRIVFLAFVLVIAAKADAVTTTTYDLTASNPFGYCWAPANNCTPLVFEIPQFDPSQGTLSEVDLSFTGSETGNIGVNDMYDPYLGVPYTAVITLELAAWLPGDPLVGLVATGGYTFDGVGYGSGQIGMDAWPHTVAVSGSLSDSNPTDLTEFEGSGTIELNLYPSISYSITGDQWPFFGSVGFGESGTLEVTYIDPVPEPRWGMLMLLPIIAGARRFYKNRVAL